MSEKEMSFEEMLEKSNTFENLGVYLTLRAREFVAYSDTYSEARKKAETEQIKLIGMIYRVKKRNKPLAKHAYLTSAPLFRKPKHDFASYKPKRGRKLKHGVLSVKWIMEYLDCSRRNAMDHQLFEKIMLQEQAVHDTMMTAISEPETMTQHDTIKVEQE